MSGAVFAGRFAGKVLVVTGAAQGIGRAVALRAAAEGGRVLLVERADFVAEVAAEAAAPSPRPHKRARFWVSGRCTANSSWWQMRMDEFVVPWVTTVSRRLKKLASPADGGIEITDRRPQRRSRARRTEIRAGSSPNHGQKMAISKRVSQIAVHLGRIRLK